MKKRSSYARIHLPKTLMILALTTRNIRYKTMGMMVEIGACGQDQRIGDNLDTGLYLFLMLNDSIRYQQIIQKL